MRLNNYITDGSISFYDVKPKPTKVKTIVSKLEKDCSEYIKEIKVIKDIIFRSVDYKIDKYGCFVPQKNRKPRDTNLRIHNLVNKIFYRKFGWYPRSEGVFTSSDTYYLVNTYDSYIYYFFR